MLYLYDAFSLDSLPIMFSHLILPVEDTFSSNISIDLGLDGITMDLGGEEG